MIAVIRICGGAKIKKEIEQTLSRLRLRRKYACSILREKPELLGMLKKVKYYTAYGKIKKEILLKLIKIRGRTPGDKGIEESKAEKIVSELMESKIEKNLQDLGLKPFFRLHPPRGGIKSKFAFPKGVLGDNGDKINELIERML